MVETRRFIASLSPRGGRVKVIGFRPQYLRVAAPRPLEDDEKDIAVLPHEGGSILFSPDVNIGVDSVTKWVKSKIKTWLQRWRAGEMVREAVVSVHKETSQDIGYMMSHRGHGRYISPTDGAKAEASFRVDFGGLDSATLDRIAEEIRKQFHQQSVLVHDHNTSRSYLFFGLNKKETPGKEKSGKQESPVYGEEEAEKILAASRKRRFLKTNPEAGDAPIPSKQGATGIPARWRV